MAVQTLHDAATAQQISKAVGAHGMWKMRLKAAIDTGKGDVDVATARVDNACEFGKWLYGQVSADAQATPYYGEVKQLHAQFHQVAGLVLELATSGKRSDAEALMGGDYARISSELTRKMMEWQGACK